MHHPRDVVRIDGRVLLRQEVDALADAPAGSAPDYALDVLAAITTQCERIVAAGMESTVTARGLSAFEWRALAECHRAKRMREMMVQASLISAALRDPSLESTFLAEASGDEDTERDAVRSQLIQQGFDLLRSMGV